VYVAYIFKCHIENKGFLKMAGSYVYTQQHW